MRGFIMVPFIYSGRWKECKFVVTQFIYSGIWVTEFIYSGRWEECKFVVTEFIYSGRWEECKFVVTEFIYSGRWEECKFVVTENEMIPVIRGSWLFVVAGYNASGELRWFLAFDAANYNDSLEMTELGISCNITIF